MPRRRPGQLRAEHLPQLDDFTNVALTTSVFPWLSPWGRVLARLEHHRFWPGATARALFLWQDFVRHPYHRVWQPRYEQLDPTWDSECCGSAPGSFGTVTEVRWVLDVVAHNLPARDARRFREVLNAIDRNW